MIERIKEVSADALKCHPGLVLYNNLTCASPNAICFAVSPISASSGILDDGGLGICPSIYHYILGFCNFTYRFVRPITKYL